MEIFHMITNHFKYFRNSINFDTFMHLGKSVRNWKSLAVTTNMTVKIFTISNVSIYNFFFGNWNLRICLTWYVTVETSLRSFVVQNFLQAKANLLGVLPMVTTINCWNNLMSVLIFSCHIFNARIYCHVYVFKSFWKIYELRFPDVGYLCQ